MRKLILVDVVLALAALLTVLMPCVHGLAAEPKYGGTLRIGINVPQEEVLDVRNMRAPNQAPAAVLTYDHLFNWGKTGYDTIVPELATKYETTDAKVWTIHLRKGVKFHNGREMTAQDVKVNLDWRIDTPKGWMPVRNRDFFKYLKRVEVIDRYTVKLILDQPFAPMMRIVTYALMGIAPPEEVEKWQDKFTFHPCGTGPFKVVQIKPSERVVLERFDGYWGPRPYLDRVETVFIRDDSARLIALEKGEIDIAYLYDDAKPVLDKDPNFQYKEVLNMGRIHEYCFNVRRWPMNDVRFRKAVWMGADWRNIAVNAWPFKSGNYARSFLDKSKFFNEESVKLVPPYNPEESKKLIREVEKDAGKKIPPIYWLDMDVTGNRTASEMAQAMLAQVGIPLDLHLMTLTTWTDKIVRDPKTEWDIGGYGLDFATDPLLGLNHFVSNSKVAPDGKSLGGYSNLEFDKWMIKAEQSVKEKDRVKCYQEAEKILFQDAAAIPLFYSRFVIGWNKKVKGFVPHPTSVIYVCNTWTNMWIER